jgi:hypothetical protein
MVDRDRWNKWMTLLDFVNANGQAMTMGEYSLAMQFDNAPTVPNTDQADSDHDGIGDVIDDAQITASDIQVDYNSPTASIISARLANTLGCIANQTLKFSCDVNGDNVNENFTAVTDSNGNAKVSVNFTLPQGSVKPYTVFWDGIVITASIQRTVTIANKCSLIADFSGDCKVDYVDLVMMCDSWLYSGDPGNCQLTYDIAGNDCLINFKDFAVLAQEWFMNN